METPKIYAALAKFAAECPTIVKDAVNPHFKNRYATLTNIQQTVAKPLTAAKLVATHRVEAGQLVTEVVSVEDGSKLTSAIDISISDPQKAGSAITYFKRYNLAAILDLDIDDDDDGEVAVVAHKEAAVESEKKWLNVTKFKGSKEHSMEWELMKAATYNGEYATAQDLIKEAGSLYKLSGAVRAELESLFATYLSDKKNEKGLTDISNPAF